MKRCLPSVACLCFQCPRAAPFPFSLHPAAVTSEAPKMPSEQAFDMVCLGGGVAAGELVHEHRRSTVIRDSSEGWKPE